MDARSGMPDTRGMPRKRPSRLIHEPFPELAAWRELRNLSRQHVVDRMAAIRPESQIDQASIAKWEKGETPIRVQDLRILATVYSTTLDRLFFDPGDEARVARMQEAYDIINTRDPAAVDAWRACGKGLREAKNLPKKDAGPRPPPARRQREGS